MANVGTDMQKSKWFLIRKPKPDAAFRLFCFPYAGGSAASYAAWDDLLPDSIELVAIQPPGRANRMDEDLLTSVGQMAQHVAEAIPPLLDRPYMIYGHSLGSAVSFELLHALKERELPLPFKYICGARRAPQNAPRIPPIPFVGSTGMTSICFTSSSPSVTWPKAAKPSCFGSPATASR